MFTEGAHGGCSRKVFMEVNWGGVSLVVEFPLAVLWVASSSSVVGTSFDEGKRAPFKDAACCRVSFGFLAS